MKRPLAGAALAVAALAGLAPAPLKAQHAPPGDVAGEHAGFVAQAREGTARYRDQRAAAAEGFRRVGTDFPAMGEHWVSTERIFADTLDPARPAVLAYAAVHGVPTLVGVAYALPLDPGERLPAFPGAGAWHRHAGTVDEESLELAHDGGAHEVGAPDDAGGMSLALLHAWVWSANPAGAFATDNWALPFVRLGIPTPAGDERTAARALALATGGERYFGDLLVAHAAADSADAAAVRAVLATQAAAVRSWLDRRGTDSALAASELTKLQSHWAALWSALDAAVSAPVGRRLALVRQRWR